MRCYAPDPAGEANSAPSDLLAEFWGEDREGKGSEKEKGRRGMCERGRKGKEKEAKAKSRGGKEETKRRGKRKGKENEKKKRGGKGRKFVQL